MPGRDPSKHKCGPLCRRLKCQYQELGLLPALLPMPRQEPREEPRQEQPSTSSADPRRYRAPPPSPEPEEFQTEPSPPSRLPRLEALAMLASAPVLQSLVPQNQHFNGPYAPPMPSSSSLLYRAHRPWYSHHRVGRNRDWQQYQYLLRQREFLLQQQQWVRLTVEHEQQRRREQDRLQELLLRGLHISDGTADPPTSDGDDSD